MKALLFYFLAVFAILGYACSPSPVPSQPQPESATATQEVVQEEPTPTSLPAETQTPSPAFEAATYRDEAAGFAFDHPSGWSFDGGETGSRGSYVQFYSWDWQPGDPIDPMPAGGTILSVTTQLWDPKNDLEAFIEQRKLAWEASGISILSEEHLILAGERPAAEFIVQGTDGLQSYFLLTTNGENYLVLSGSGDLDLLAAVSHTLRPIQ